MATVIDLLNKIAPAEPLDVSKIVPPKFAPSERDRELADERELAQLEAAYNSLFESAGESWASIATKHRARVRELSEAITATKSQLSGHSWEGPVRRKLAKAEVELEGLIRKLAVAETQAAANIKARADFEQDGRMKRLQELRKTARPQNPLLQELRQAMRVRDPL